VNEQPLRNTVVTKLHAIILNTLRSLLLAAVIVATIDLVVLFVRGLWTSALHVTSVDFLHLLLERTFGGVLIVFLGLELLETLSLHLKKLEVRLQEIIAVATIAVARQAVILDATKTSAIVLFSLAAMILALATAYFFIRRSAPFEVDDENGR
jgi:uncharacterized membrane protein (DUF373 family)